MPVVGITVIGKTSRKIWLVFCDMPLDGPMEQSQLVRTLDLHVVLTIPSAACGGFSLAQLVAILTDRVRGARELGTR